MEQFRETKLVRGRFHILPGTSCEIAHEGLPEGEVFLHRQFALHGVAMAEIVHGFGGARDRSAIDLDLDSAFIRREEPADDADQS